MENTNILETHFKLIDFTKNLLFNSTTLEHEEQARRLLKLAKEQEKNFKI